jgi:hypothetical protein
VGNHLGGIAIRSSPQLAIQCAEADGFANVIGGDAIGAFEVGDGTGDFEDAILGAGAEVVFGHGGLEHGERRFVQRAVGLEFARAHTRIAGDSGSVLEPLLLDVARGDDPFANRGGRFAVALAGDVLEFHGRHFDVQIDPVEQRAGDAVQIIRDLAR